MKILESNFSESVAQEFQQIFVKLQNQNENEIDTFPFVFEFMQWARQGNVVEWKDWKHSDSVCEPFLDKVAQISSTSCCTKGVKTPKYC